MYSGLSSNNSPDIVANSIRLVQRNIITDILNIIAQNGADSNAITTALLNDQNVINAIAASATNSYTKTESENLCYTKTYKVNTSTVNSYYTKIEIDTNNYTKTQIDTNMYTKTNIDNL